MNINDDISNQNTQLDVFLETPTVFAIATGDDQQKDDDFTISTNHEAVKEGIIIGMEFISTEDAYKHYTSYASQAGFDVRKHHLNKNAKGFVTSVRYVCSKQGFRRKDKRSTNPSYIKPATRIGCAAGITCLLQKNGYYKVTEFKASHNHDLIRTPMKHLLKVNRSISDAQKSHADDTEMAGISIKASMDLLSREIGGREYIGFTAKDFKNYIHRKRMQAMEKGDAGAILEYFDKKQSNDSSYKCSMQLDEDEMITNIFWADSRSISDYSLFGDVVCFDTTYRTNEYGRPFAPFIGVNHHKQTIIFGAALLYDETIDSFKWLFQTFLNTMSGKKPKTILTDQSAAMANAISQVFGKETHHRLCVWHIYQNAAKNLSHVFHGSKEFVNDFNKCMYDYEDENEWLLAWTKMLDEYGLKENAWLKSQFDLKEKWALVYGRHTFTADMKSTQRSESMNNVLKKYLKPSHNLLRFLEHYERVLDDRRYEELLADFKMMNTEPVPIISTGMLQHGMEVYTPEVFNLFQDEYMKILNYDTFKICKEGSTSTYKVCFAGTQKEHYVTFEALTQSVCCSCSKFTYLGILCAHALKVLDKKNVKYIPTQYIEKRWSKNAKARSIAAYSDVKVHDNPKESVGKRYSYLCRNFREVAMLASDHDKLTKYAHECLVELLRKLEEMKRICLSQGLNDVNELHDGALVVGSQRVNELVTTLDNSTMKPVGVKRKATVGRPRGRFKDPLERNRSKAKTTATKSIKKKLSFGEESHHQIVNVQEDQILDDAPQIFSSMSQDVNMNATTSNQNLVSFTQLLQNSIAGYSSR